MRPTDEQPTAPQVYFGSKADLEEIRPVNPLAPWYIWLLPAFLIGLCIVLVVTA